MCAVLLVFSSAAVAQAADGDRGENDKFGWVEDESAGGVILTKIKTDTTDDAIIIPDTLGGKPVVGLGSNPFWNYGYFYFDKLVIPATVKTIDPGFMTSYSHQGKYFTAFEVEESSPYFKAVDGVLYSKDGTTLVRCPLGKSGTFTVPEDVKEIAKYGFYCCGITDLRLNEGLTSVGDSAFYQMPITSISLPSTLMNFGKSVFGQTTITDITLAMDTVPASLMQNCYELKTVTLKEGVRVIGQDAFHGCGDLVSVNFPSTLEVIEKGVFDFCYDLTSIALNEGLQEIGEDAFEYCGMTELEIPSTVASIGSGAFSHTKFPTVEIPASVKEIGAYAFSNSALTAAAVPATVTTLGVGAFSNCLSLLNASIEPGRTVLPSYTFNGCKALTSVQLPESIVEIGAGAFENCNVLPEILLPAGLKTIGRAAFKNCMGMDSITIPDGVTVLPIDALSWCWSLSEVNLPANLETIDMFAFEQCKSLQSLHIPATLQRINSSAFQYTPALQEVILEGNAPALTNNVPINPFASEGRKQPMKLYIREHATGFDKKPWTDMGENLIVLAEPTPPEPTPIPTSISFTTELERSPQDDLILWMKPTLTYDEGLLEDDTMAPAGAVHFYLNGSLWTPKYFVGGNSTQVGFSVKSYLGQTVELRAVYAGSRGFEGSESETVSLEISVNTMLQSVQQRIRELPDHLPGNACESPEEFETHRRMVGDAYYAYTSLNYQDVRLMDTALIQKVREQYKAVIAYLDYVTSTEDQTVEVVGVTENVTLPENADSIKLNVAPVEEPEDTDAKAALEKAAAAAAAENNHTAQVACYDIKLMASMADGSTAVVQPDENKTVAVKVKLPDGIDTETLKIFHIKDSVEEPEEIHYLLTETDGVQYAVLETGSFSYFAFFAEPLNDGDSGDNLPDDNTPGDNTPDDNTPGGDTPGGDTPGGNSGSNGGDVTPPPAPLELLADIKGHWAFDSIAYAVENGLLLGTSDTTFEPGAPMSRAMLVTVLWRMAGEPEPAAPASYDDVKPGTWYSKAVAWASEQKLAYGTGDGLFQPMDGVSRQDFAAFLYRYADWARIDVSGVVDLSAYADADTLSEYAWDAAAWCAREEIIAGKPGGYFAPRDTTTRAEAAIMLRAFREGPAK